MPRSNSDNWEAWGNHVLTEMERMNKEIIHTRQEMTNIKIEIAMLKTKSSTWGAVAGIIGGSLASILATILVKLLFG